MEYYEHLKRNIYDFEKISKTFTLYKNVKEYVSG